MQEFARQGSRVVAAARDGASLEQLVAECHDAGAAGEVVAFVADVGRYEEMEALAAATVERFGRVDSWVNCAAVHEYAWFEDTTPEEFATVLRTNVLGQVHGTYAALPHLFGNDRGGTIVGISSVEGVRALQAPYVTGKFALRGFYDTVRMEMTNRHPAVKIVTILPASIDTPIFEDARNRLPRMPMPPKPLYGPEVVARAIVYAARHPRAREIPVGGSAAMFILGQRFAPAVMDFLFSRKPALLNQQQTELPAVPEDNLDGPPAEPQQTRSWRLESSKKIRKIKERSLFTELVWQHPMIKRALVMTATASAAAVGSRLISAERRQVQPGRTAGSSRRHDWR